MLILALFGITFLAGLLAGMGVMVCLGIAREERRNSLHHEPPGPAAAATRGLVGLHARGPSAVDRYDSN